MQHQPTLPSIPWSTDLWVGFRAILPLWFGALPIGLSYALAARQAGLHASETILMSILVCSAGVQFSAVNLLQSGAATESILLTILALMLYQLLFGLSLACLFRLRPWQIVLGALFLNDGPYGVTIAQARPSFALMLGAELSMWIAWNAATTLGVLLGDWQPLLPQLGLDLTVPVLFLALLLPQIRSRTTLLLALGSGLITLLLTTIVSSSIAVLLAVLISGSCTWLLSTVLPKAGGRQQ